MRLSEEDKTPMKFVSVSAYFFAFDYWTSGALVTSELKTDGQ